MFPKMGVTVTSPALRLADVVWLLQKPTKEFMSYFLPSKLNHLSQSKKNTSVRLTSSPAIPSVTLAITILGATDQPHLQL